jgi:hypothetical protein
MPAKTAHILPKGDGWVVKRERDHVVAKKRSNLKTSGKSGAERVIKIFPTQAAAIEWAMERVGHGELDGQRRKQSAAGQIVVHSRNGSVRWREIHGLPKVQTPPRKSELGTNAIKKAVSTAIRERLERE